MSGNENLASALIAAGWSSDSASLISSRVHERPKFARFMARRFLCDRTPAPRRLPAKPKATIPPELRWAVWERDDFTCRHCGVRQFLTADHVVPESAGGPTILENLQTLCGTCNCKKGAHMM